MLSLTRSSGAAEIPLFGKSDDSFSFHVSGALLERLAIGRQRFLGYDLASVND
jgi:hypothetical protein